MTSDYRSDTLPLIELGVHNVTRVLHTAGINNVESLLCCEKETKAV